jgi:xanthine/CO dehydrogenase XdhC/CoxF family maturation factor
MNRRETERILRAIGEARHAGQRVALATVVRVSGSAYRREGARIVVREDGSYECLVSGGCLEPTVADAAAHVIETGRSSIKQYDLQEDSIWSLGVGCSGAVDILIERVDDDPMTRSWLRILEHAEPGVLVRRLSALNLVLLVSDTQVLGTLGDVTLDREAAERARVQLGTTFPQSGLERVGDEELFFEVSVPPPNLLVFGAGADAEPLVAQGWSVGFNVAVVDARDAFLKADRFPHATLISSHFSRFSETVPLSDRSFVVIMNHHLERDRESLRFALGSPAPYVGVLGPTARFERLLSGLRADGWVADATALARVRSPIGLALGAETPEEIAISILGEMLALQRGFDGGFLTGRRVSLHRVPENSALARS